MRIRQSDLKTWSRCPLSWRYQHIDNVPREQSAALTFGTVIHHCVLVMEEQQSLKAGLLAFETFWTDPEALEAGLTPTYYVSGTSWEKYYDEGRDVLEAWWNLIQWEADVVLAREHHFVVPMVGTDHEVEGTVDKLAIRYLPKENRYAILVSDYKTNKKRPTYNYLAHDLQFSMYCYASTQPEFWTGISNGDDLFERYRDAPRVGEWVQLLGPTRIPAGERNELHYNRLRYAVNALADSVAMRIFVPNISGETCAGCDFRAHCGLPDTTLDEGGAGTTVNWSGQGRI